jgi:hypothetical protein
MIEVLSASARQRSPVQQVNGRHSEGRGGARSD